MKGADLAEALGVSIPMVSKWKKRGMPLTSVADAQAWREKNTVRGRGKDRKKPLASLDTTGIAAIEKKLGQQARVATIEEAEQYLTELEEMRRFAKEAAESLWSQGYTDDSRKWLAVHQAIAKGYPDAHRKVLDLKERHRSLISTQDAQAEFTGFLLRIRGLMETMPASLSAKANPADPEHAREQLERWRDESLYKTLSTAPSVLP